MNQTADLTQTASGQRRALRVTMLGIRGFPDVQGGAEKHAEKLACALTDLGCHVEAIARSSYVPKERTNWRGITMPRLWAPRVTGLEAFFHTFLGVLRSAWHRPDVLHIHAIGPALFTPLARALGLRVVITHHVLNYENEKWGAFGRSVLRLGEWAGLTFANGRIAVSEGLAKQMQRTYGLHVHAIPNGIDKPMKIQSTETLQAFGLVPGRYAVTVARLDEQKRQLDLIEAYARLDAPAWKLALVGSADYSSAYARAVIEAAKNVPGVVLLGQQTGAALAELYTHAAAFVLPSGHEGQPIAVLEAVSYGLPVILSDIPAHREMGLSSAPYFPVGDVAALADHLGALFAAGAVTKSDAREQARIMAKHDWHTIAQRTLAVYCDALSDAKRDVAAGAPPARIEELS